MKAHLSKTLFLLFFVSGFCGLLYQVVWVRMAFASFGIVTSVLSVVISVFMFGLSIGSWAGGKWIGPLTQRTRISAIYLYGVAEFIIGLGAFIVPTLFFHGETVLLSAGESDSGIYLFFSAIVIALSIFPWCVFMGTTFPFMMAFAKEVDPSHTRSFSFLYLANVIGAMSGTLITATVLVELLGFRHTLWTAGSLNFLIAGVSAVLGLRIPDKRPYYPTATESKVTAGTNGYLSFSDAILFTTGFVSLAMEVVWTRAFTPVMGTQVYAFALLLFVYLLATCSGVFLYRKRNQVPGLSSYSKVELMALLSVFAFLPVTCNDPRIFGMHTFISDPRVSPFSLRAVLALISIAPFCVVLGYLTPQLIDGASGGNPRKAGRAYAVNILGCILGPLFASYVLLPGMGVKLALILLAIPFLIFSFVYYGSLHTKWRYLTGAASTVLLAVSIFWNVTYEDPGSKSENREVRRDHTATVIVEGSGREKMLWVNGVGITILTPITKYMAHLPLAFHTGQAESALVICFGMGTTYRSLLSWEIEATAVELIPSVRDSFRFFFDDVEAILKNPKGRIIIDDGRRFLRRTDAMFDVVTVDPPPPAEAAGSSLLYSEHFYTLVKRRLKSDGILQQWFGVGEPKILQAIIRSLSNSFPYVRVYPSIEGWGYHFLASASPIGTLAAEEMISRLPEPAQRDLLEWSVTKDLKADIKQILRKEIPPTQLLSTNPQVRITDDRPFNEYFLLRRLIKDAFEKKESHPNGNHEL